MQVDKVALDALNDSAEVHLQSLEPWIQVYIYIYAFVCIHAFSTGIFDIMLWTIISL